MSASEPHLLPDLNSGPRSFITTSQDHAGIALVMCTLLATWAVLCLIVRVYMRATVSGPFGKDDALCSLATVFGTVHSIVASTAISFGFGKSLHLLSVAQVVQVSKAIYVTQLLYIVTNALTKCTVALLLARIVFIRSRVLACYGIFALSCLWAVGAFIAAAIRCPDSPPWKIVGSRCTNQYQSWKAITACNILIETLIFVMPIWLVWGLQTGLKRKCTVVAVFSLRLPVIVAAGLRVRFLGETIGSAEPLLRGVLPFILMNLEMHYGLIAATIPTLKPFVTAFNTGWGTYDTQGISGYGQTSGGGSYALHSLGREVTRSGGAGSGIGVSSGGGGGAGRGGGGGGKGHKGSASTRGGGKGSRMDSQSSSIGSGDLESARGPGSLRPMFASKKNITHVRSGGALHRDEKKQKQAGARLSNASDDSKLMIIRQTRDVEVHVEGGSGDDHSIVLGGPPPMMMMVPGDDGIEPAKGTLSLQP